jgi:hypothetical protein
LLLAFKQRDRLTAKVLRAIEASCAKLKLQKHE